MNATETTVELKRPSELEFATIWNASSSRKDALARFLAAGFHMTYSALVARHKSYAIKGITLNDIPAAARGRRTDVAAVNAALAAQAAAAASETQPTA